MTANELADYLDNNVEAMIMSEQQHIDKAATMLRQQQAEIEALKKELALQRLSDIGQAIERVLTDKEIMIISHEALEQSGLTKETNTGA